MTEALGEANQLTEQKLKGIPPGRFLGIRANISELLNRDGRGDVDNGLIVITSIKMGGGDIFYTIRLDTGDATGQYCGVNNSNGGSFLTAKEVLEFVKSNRVDLPR